MVHCKTDTSKVMRQFNWWWPMDTKEEFLEMAHKYGIKFTDDEEDEEEVEDYDN